MSKALQILLTGFLLAGALLIVAVLWQVASPWKGFDDDRRIVTIPPGQSARAAADALHDAGVIRSRGVFLALLKLRGADAAIHAGEYEFVGASSPSAVLGRLVRGDVLRHRLTIPEGLRLDEVAAQVETAGFASAGDFLDAARHIALIRDLDARAVDLEGYLFPDTYMLPRTAPAGQIVAAMISRFRREMTPDRMSRMKDLNLSVREAMTLASLIEEEAQVEEERARISSVFHNRLARGMLLQCDPTVVYALAREGRYRGRIYRSDLEYASPYNTYVHPGLPPGPICSPGSASIDAALSPARTDDLYFVVNGPGTHAFSTNVADHERAVQRYRRQQRLAGREGGSP